MGAQKVVWDGAENPRAARTRRKAHFIGEYLLNSGYPIGVLMDIFYESILNYIIFYCWCNITMNCITRIRDQTSLSVVAMLSPHDSILLVHVSFFNQ